MTNDLETREMIVRAVDTDKREVSGLAVPYDTDTDIGGYYTERISRGAVQDSDDALLYWRHEEPIGRITSSRDTESGWEITAKISATPRGDEAYTLLRDGVIDKFSIGFESHVHEFDEDTNTITRTNIRVREVSLVPFPAYEGAQVAQVRAAVNSNDNRKEDTVTDNLTRADLDSALDDFERKFEATFTTRDAEPAGDTFRSFGDMVKRVAAGEEIAVRAYEGAVSGDAILKDAWIGNLVNILHERQTVAQTFQTGALPASGMGVEYAVLESDTTQVGVQAAEGDDLLFGKVSIDIERAGVKTLGGWSSLSRQTIERSNVGILDTTFTALAEKYGRAVEVLARQAFTAGVAAQTANAVEGDLTTQDGIVALLLDLVEEFDDRGHGLDGIFVAKDVFKSLYAVESTDRILQVTTAPTDKVGTLTLSSIEANLAGVQVRMLPGATAGLVAAYDRKAVKTLESPGAPLRLQDENIVNLTKDFSVYGYATSFVQVPDAIVPVVAAAA